MSLSEHHKEWIEAKIKDSGPYSREEVISATQDGLADKVRAVDFMMSMDDTDAEFSHQLKLVMPNMLALVEALLGDPLYTTDEIQAHLAKHPPAVPHPAVHWEFFQKTPTVPNYPSRSGVIRFDQYEKQIKFLPSGMRGTDLSSWVARVFHAKTRGGEVPPTILDGEGVVKVVKFLINAVQSANGKVSLVAVDLFSDPAKLPFSITVSGPVEPIQTRWNVAKQGYRGPIESFSW